MMKRFLLFAGLLCIARPAFAESGETLYQRIHAAVLDEVNTQQSELAVERFAAGAYYKHTVTTSIKDDSGVETLMQFPVVEKNVDQALLKDELNLCGDDHNMFLPCITVENTLDNLVKRASWNRSLGRKLQTIASGYESAIYGYPAGSGSIDVSLRLDSISTIWRAGNDTFIDPMMESFVRAAPLPDKQVTQQAILYVLNGMKSRLIRIKDNKKDDTDFAAAVWRYRNGVKYVKNHEGSCNAAATPSTPDRTNDERRFCDVESALSTIHDQIMATAVIDPPKQPQEQIIFPSVIDKKLNVLVWIRDDDIGLQWIVATTPMQVPLFNPRYADCLDGGSPPEACASTYGMILGGNYPASLDGSGSRVPEPKETEGICSHPFARRGYLCHPIESENCDMTPEDVETASSSSSTSSSSASTHYINLTECAPERFIDDVARRISGSDVCGIGGWRTGAGDGSSSSFAPGTIKDDHTLQVDMAPNSCSVCAIDIHCEDTCEGQTDFSVTSAVKVKGVIHICVPRIFDNTGLDEYLVAHELVHAQQECQQSDLQSQERGGLLSDENGDGIMQESERVKGAAACCALEREAYFVQCKMLAQDGILDGTNLQIDQCASDLANLSCSKYETTDGDGNKVHACTTDGVDPAKIKDIIDKAVLKKKPTLTAPMTCDDIVDNPTERMKAIYESMPMACNPGCQSKYANTIGNNLCYTGQCVEQTMEFARPIAGRTALTETDQTFPFDSCELPDPNIAAVAAPPAFMGPKLPSYNPGQLLQNLDMALCQQNGLPARTPPVICAYDPLRRILLPLLSGTESADSLREQPEEYAAAHFALEEAAGSIGAMTVSDMFGQYLRPAARQFADLVDMMRITLATVGKTKFPSVMCPRNIDPNSLCQPLQQ